VQVDPVFEQISPALHQKPPPVSPGQHASPVPPQPTQMFPWHAVNGDVHPTPPAQHTWPMPPHAPAWQDPVLHAPWPPPQAEPLATHARVD
jgi:hypothetical protein